MVSPPAGTADVTCASYNQFALHIISFTGYVSLGTPSTNTGTTANPSVTVADSSTAGIVVAAISNDSATGNTVQANSLIFEAEDVDADTDHSSQYKVPTGSNTVMSWTQSDSGSGWAATGLMVYATAPPSGGFLNRNLWWDNF
jgi:hypothetical protein